MAKVIGILGVAGAGKSTAADMLVGILKDMGHEVIEASFAEPIRTISQLTGLEPYDRHEKERLRAMDYETFSARFFDAIEDVLRDRLDDNTRALLYSFTMDALQKYRTSTVYDGVEVEQINLSPRIFMQVLGTEGGQSVCKTLWVDLAAADWAHRPGFVLCSDVRFNHEFPVCDHAFLLVRNQADMVAEHKSEKLAQLLTLRAKKPPIMSEVVVYTDSNPRFNKLVNVVSNGTTYGALYARLVALLAKLGVAHG